MFDDLEEEEEEEEEESAANSLAKRLYVASGSRERRLAVGQRDRRSIRLLFPPLKLAASGFKRCEENITKTRKLSLMQRKPAFKKQKDRPWRERILPPSFLFRFLGSCPFPPFSLSLSLCSRAVSRWCNLRLNCQSTGYYFPVSLPGRPSERGHGRRRRAGGRAAVAKDETAR